MKEYYPVEHPGDLPSSATTDDFVTAITRMFNHMSALEAEEADLMMIELSGCMTASVLAEIVKTYYQRADLDGEFRVLNNRASQHLVDAAEIAGVITFPDESLNNAAQTEDEVLRYGFVR